MIFNIGPFQLYRTEHSGTLDITLRCIENWPCGWEYGWKDDMRGPDHPAVELRVGKLQVFYFEKYEKGFELWLFGFWWIM
jgi:hypothetical protein